MRTCAVKDLFDVRYGNGLELTYLRKSSRGCNFVARGKKDNGVVATVHKVIGVEPFPAGCITVAVGGSVMESFLQTKPFYTAYHVMILTPRDGIEMSDAVKLFYCMCLRHNKFRYSYGRQANETLKDLQIPVLEDIPDYVKEFSMSQFKAHMVDSVDISVLSEKSATTATRQELVPLHTLFRLENGIASTNVLRSPIKETSNWIPYVRPSYTQATSVDAYVNKHLVPQNKVYPKGTLYVSTNGQGSHTYSYVSATEFVPNSDVTVLLPLRPMTIREKLFYSMCISHNRFKFSYGRKPKGERLASLMIPKAIDGELNDMDLLEILNRL